MKFQHSILRVLVFAGRTTSRRQQNIVWLFRYEQPQNYFFRKKVSFYMYIYRDFGNVYIHRYCYIFFKFLFRYGYTNGLSQWDMQLICTYIYVLRFLGNLWSYGATSCCFSWLWLKKKKCNKYFFPNCEQRKKILKMNKKTIQL